MKEARITYAGKERKFRYEVRRSNNFVYANVWDKHGERHQFHLNCRGDFLRPISVRGWPDGLLLMVDAVLKAETPVPVVDKPGYLWERNQ